MGIKSFGIEPCIAPYGIALLIHKWTIVLLQQAHHQTVLFPSMGIKCHLLTPILSAYLLQGFKTKLLMMEPVERTHSLRKACLYYVVHTLREVESNLFHAHSQRFWYLHQCLYDILCLSALDYSNKASLATMCILVRGYCVYLSRGQACLIYADVRTYVLWEDEPLVSMA